MRIGIVTGEYPPMQGGVGAFSHILATTLRAQGHEVCMFSGPQSRQTDDIPLRQTRAWGIRSLVAIKQWATGNALDVINLQFQTAAYQMSPWIHFLPRWAGKIPVVTTFHDLRFPYLFPKAGKLRDWIVMHLAKTSAGVITTNHEDYERVKHLPCSAIVPIGSNILTDLLPGYNRRAWRKKVGAGDNDFLLAYFGFLNRSKGMDTLLDSLALLCDENIPAKLVMIGGRTGTSDPTNATYADEIDRKLNRPQLAGRIAWTGFVSETEVTAFLHAANAVVLPFLDGASYRRGTLMAAIQHDCAIITTTPQVTIPAFKQAENMLFVPPGDARALSAAIKTLYTSPGLCETLRQGAARLKHEFEWSSIAQQTAAFFLRVVEAQK